VRLEVFDRIVDVAAEGFDLDVRVGDEIAPHLIAGIWPTTTACCARPRLCAAARHRARSTSCRRMTAWSSRSATTLSASGSCARAEERSVKVTGPLSTNNGEMAVQWAADGHGIVLRSLWDAADLQAGACAGAGRWSRRRISGPSIRRGWSARPRCGSAWSSCRSHLAEEAGLQGPGAKLLADEQLAVAVLQA
jgi:LysR family transcriptional activator of dmlA